MLGRSEQEGCVDLELNVAVQRGAWATLLNKYYELLGTKLRAESADTTMRGDSGKQTRLEMACLLMLWVALVPAIEWTMETTVSGIGLAAGGTI